jgi:hypothetical protein
VGVLRGLERNKYDVIDYEVTKSGWPWSRGREVGNSPAPTILKDGSDFANS